MTSAPPAPAVRVPLPTWVPPAARFVLALILIYFGVKAWIDGYSMAAVEIGIGLLVAEFVGFGVSRSQATSLANYIAQLELQLAGKPPSPPPQ